MNRVVQWLQSAEAWLDARGKPAWIAAMVFGFILVWPIGLAILFFMIWSGRMNCSKHSWKRNTYRRRMNETGNTAFDKYREETLRRLQEEQSAFVGFLEKLRKAKDKAEFDQFMNERNRPDPEGSAPA
ncbi:MAG: DUF2852 domain-containing protein [Pseudomonadota bacterium]